MKKTKVLFLILCVLLSTLLLFVGCDDAPVDEQNSGGGDDTSTACTHQWSEATCTKPKTCKLCKDTEGNALGHDWSEATCTKPKTCKLCKDTEGDALGHDWEDATCTVPKTCSICEETKGSALNHTWSNATCTAPKTCSVCNATEGSTTAHTWVDATCTAPKTCSTCSTTEGSKAAHTWVDATCTAPKTCSACNTTEGSKAAHTWVDATCTAPKTCSICKATTGKSNETAHSGSGVCTLCGKNYFTTLANYVMAYGKQGVGPSYAGSYSYASLSDSFYVKGQSYKLTVQYTVDTNIISVALRKNETNAPFFTVVIDANLSGSYNYTYNDLYNYDYNGVWDTVTGTIVAKDFTSSTTQLPYSEIKCLDGKHTETYIAGICATQLRTWLTCFDSFCKEFDLGLSHVQFGFVA